MGLKKTLYDMGDVKRNVSIDNENFIESMNFNILVVWKKMSLI